jgi:hypothetical protein
MEKIKNDQIEAMANIIDSENDCIVPCRECPYYSLTNCRDVKSAEKLYNAGCRMIGDTVIELPCKLGDPIYIIKRCHCSNPGCFLSGSCYKRRVARKPEVLDRRMILERKTRFSVDESGRVVRDIDKPVGTICYTIYEKPFTLNMIAELGKTVFSSIESAKDALDEIWRKAK